jgi:hypothetical protein
MKERERNGVRKMEEERGMKEVKDGVSERRRGAKIQT